MNSLVLILLGLRMIVLPRGPVVQVHVWPQQGPAQARQCQTRILSLGQRPVRPLNDRH